MFIPVASTRIALSLNCTFMASNTKSRKPVNRSSQSRYVNKLIDDFEAHLAGGTGDDAEGGFVVARV